jgi:hypothetical protein
MVIKNVKFMEVFKFFFGRDLRPSNMRDFLKTAACDGSEREFSKRLLTCLSGFFVLGGRIERSMAASGFGGTCWRCTCAPQFS